MLTGHKVKVELQSNAADLVAIPNPACRKCGCTMSAEGHCVVVDSDASHKEKACQLAYAVLINKHNVTTEKSMT